MSVLRIFCKAVSSEVVEVTETAFGNTEVLFEAQKNTNPLPVHVKCIPVEFAFCTHGAVVNQQLLSPAPKLVYYAIYQANMQFKDRQRWARHVSLRWTRLRPLDLRKQLDLVRRNPD